MDENTGSGALPRNKGLSLSSGEYIFNMDNDDMLTKTALEELYTLAKEWDADVVYCERYYEVDQDGSNMKINVIQRGKLVDKPTLEPEDMKERVQRIVDDRYWVVPWSKLIRRSLMVENGIIFPALKISDDNIWNQGLLFHSKRFLRVPNMIYIYRLTKTSIMRRDKTPQVRMNFWIDPVLRGLKYLDDLMSNNEFFRKNASKRYTILRKFVDTRFTWILSSSRELYEDAVYKTIKNEYGKYFGEYDVLIPCLCSYLCDRNKKLSESKKLLDEKSAEIKRLKDKVHALKTNSSSQTGCLDISVIIPLYNAEEYVGECLDSLLNQTFQNFEVIVVDDCSTDNSVAIVKSYESKFKGRLRLEKTETNSGGGGYVPRNIGFKFAQGEYVYFVDADDVLLESALETFYSMAEEYDTDVIYTAAHYDSGKATEIHVSRDPKGKEMHERGIQDKPTLFVDKFKENLHGLIVDRGFSTPWAHFIRREFLIKNKIVFPEIPKAGDYIWAINIYCYARRFLRFSTPLYCYRRYNANSVSQNKKANEFSNWIMSFAVWTKTLDEIINSTNILKKNPSYCYEATKRWFEWCLNRTNDARKKLSDQDIYEILYREFNKNNSSFQWIMPFFLSTIDNARKERNDHLQTIKDLEKEIARLKKKA